MHQQYDYIIIGQGITGTMLSWQLHEAGQRVLVYDEGRPHSASGTAAGIINPVSGRKFELAWLYETIYPVAARCYHAMEQALGITCFFPRDIWNVWPSAQMRDAFDRALTTIPAAYMEAVEASRYEGRLNQPFGAGIVKGANVQLSALLPAWRSALRSRGQLREERFSAQELQPDAEGVRYRDVRARGAIFCEGAESPANPYFSGLRFLPNKGEVLLVDIPGLATTDIIKKSITLVPWDGDTYWAGATFSWDYTDDRPTEAARTSLTGNLSQLLSLPFTIRRHMAAVRPSGMDRRPFVGMHPRYPQIGIFNGMGSKGCSLAPWAAGQFCRHLLEGAPLQQEIDIKRYFNALR